MRRLLVLALALALPAAVAAVLVQGAGAHRSVSPCATLRMTGKTIAAKAGKLVGTGTVAQPDSEHPNECDFFSSTTGHEARVYVWPASQQASAVASLVGGSFAGQTVKKRPLSGLGAGALSYNGVPTFLAGPHFVAIFPVGLSNAQALGVARLIRSALA
jgi:hypothetical protein